MEDYKTTILGDTEVIHHPDVKKVASAHRGWVVGPYVCGTPNAPFEVKEGCHQEGEERTEYSTPAEGYTWSRVITGSITIFFLTSQGEESVTLSAGEALSHANTVPHKWHVNENNTLVLTVRTTKD